MHERLRNLASAPSRRRFAEAIGGGLAASSLGGVAAGEDGSDDRGRGRGAAARERRR